MALIILALAIAGPIAFVGWFIDLPIAEQIPTSIGVAGVLALLGYSVWFGWKEHKRKEREYRQTLLEFRWREDMSPIEFERCCADYLNLRNWDATTTRASGDQGADVIARKVSHLLVLQCKKYSKPVGNKAVQEVIAARVYQRATAAAVVSNQAYTPAARALAEKANVLLLHFTDLRNMDRLLGLAGEAPMLHEAGIRSRQAAPTDLLTSRIVRVCPNCEAKMRLPAGRSGMVRCPTCRALYPAKT